jgi:DNA-binding NtrC family response regulator
MKENFDALVEHLVKTGFFLEQAVEILEKAMIEHVLRDKDGNQSETAKALGIHRNTLLRKMVDYQIDGKRPRSKPAGKARTLVRGKSTRTRRTA